MGADSAVHPDELVTLTAYVPVTAVILCVVAPLLHRYDDPEEAVSVTVPPHCITVPAGEIVAVAAGAALTTALVDPVHPPALVTVTV